MGSNQKSIDITDEETGEVFSFKPAALVANIRDIMLDRRRQQVEAKPWAKMTEGEQQDEIDGMVSLAHMLVNAAVDVVGAAGLTCAYVEVTKFAVDVEKNEVTITAKGSASDDMLIKLAHAKGRPCRLAVLETARFNSEGKMIKPDPDQPGMFEDDAPLLSDDGEISTADAMAAAIEADTPAEDDVDEPWQGKTAEGAWHDEDSEVRDPDGNPPSDEVPAGGDESFDDDPSKTEDAHKAGYDAAITALGPDDCPYDGGTDEFTAWHEGRNKGLDEIETLKQEGRDARADGMARTRCTWKKGTDAFKYWNLGYDEQKASETE